MGATSIKAIEVEKTGCVTYSTDQENEVSKILILSPGN